MRGEGKNDPRRLLYWKLLGFSENEAIEKSKLECKKCSPRCIEYWLKKGLSEDNAKLKVKEIQNNGKSNIGSKRTEEQKQNMKLAQSKIHTLQYWIEKYGEDFGNKKFLELKNKQIENGKLSKFYRLNKNPDTFIEGTTRRPEYWIKRGYSKEESKMMVSKSQSRGIDFYIKKYGDKKGLERWEERNKKWYNSFYNTDNDLDKINEKRKLNAHIGYYTEKTIKNIDYLNFYIITLKDEDKTMIMKYGLTKQDNISKRWSVSLNYNLFLFQKMNAKKAVDIENKFHKYFKKTYSPSIIKTTECFEYNQENLNKALFIIKEFNL